MRGGWLFYFMNYFYSNHGEQLQLIFGPEAKAFFAEVISVEADRANPMVARDSEDSLTTKGSGGIEGCKVEFTTGAGFSGHVFRPIFDL